jgi:branched-chain amino acid transport system ATP-binding protein
MMCINFGSEIARGTPEEIASHPEVIKAYLGEEYAKGK